MYHVPLWGSLIFILVVLAVAVMLSVTATSRRAPTVGAITPTDVPASRSVPDPYPGPG